MLIRKSLVDVSSRREPDEIENDDDDVEQFEQLDEKECEIEDKCWVSIEHQIVYNISYSVPVLYFKACFLGEHPART